MLMNAYSIFDTAAAAYTRPFFMPSDGEAVRACGDIAMDKDHHVGRHPECYYLCRIGTWNDKTGQLESRPPESLATALEMVARQREIELGMPGTDDLEEVALSSVNAGGSR